MHSSTRAFFSNTEERTGAISKAIDHRPQQRLMGYEDDEGSLTPIYPSRRAMSV
jgi:hypothetical protein